MSRRRWPRWSDDLVRSGFPGTSLLAGAEPAVWEALGRLAPSDFDDRKQVVLRRALEDIGLGWVATNTTPFRIAVGGLFDAAERRHRGGSADAPLPAGSGPERASVPEVVVGAGRLPEPDEPIPGPATRIACGRGERERLWKQLKTHGACVIRGAVPASALDARVEAGSAKATKLARTAGNGIAGNPPAVYMHVDAAPAWHDALERTLGELLVGPGAPGAASEACAELERRSILLLAGVGAENWAHQDANDETPAVQAVLMLSTPDEDFTGGEFYVARQTGRTEERIDIVRHEVAFEAPGDLVVFQAGKRSGWWHGMLPVGAGAVARGGHLRRALGMLQPPA